MGDSSDDDLPLATRMAPGAALQDSIIITAFTLCRLATYVYSVKRSVSQRMSVFFLLQDASHAAGVNSHLHSFTMFSLNL